MDTNLYSSCSYGNMMIETQIDIKLLCSFPSFSSPVSHFSVEDENCVRIRVYVKQNERKRVGRDIKDRGVENVLRVAASILYDE